MAKTLESIGWTQRHTSREVRSYYWDLRKKGYTHREARQLTHDAFRPRGEAWKSSTLRKTFSNLVNLAIL